MKDEKAESKALYLLSRIDNSDAERAHLEADDVLIWLIEQLGYNDVADAWVKIPKWYA